MRRRRSGIYLLPNLLTTSALFAGFFAIVASINGRYETAAIAIFTAMILDGMDGRIARMTKTETDFGIQYDSLSDVVSFGLAPALVVYQWSLHGLGKPGWLASFIFAAAEALRLARFNTQAGSADKRYFQGLPCPAAAATIAGMVWFDSHGQPFNETTMAVFAFSLTIITSLLMVSNVRYHSFKQFDLRDKVPFFNVAATALIIALIAIRPSVVLFLLALTYAASGALLTLLLLRRHRIKRDGAPAGPFKRLFGRSLTGQPRTPPPEQPRPPEPGAD